MKSWQQWPGVRVLPAPDGAAAAAAERAHAWRIPLCILPSRRHGRDVLCVMQSQAGLDHHHSRLFRQPAERQPGLVSCACGRAGCTGTKRMRLSARQPHLDAAPCPPGLIAAHKLAQPPLPSRPALKSLCQLAVETGAAGGTGGTLSADCEDANKLFNGLAGDCSAEYFPACSAKCKAAIAATGLEHVQSCYAQMIALADPMFQALMCARGLGAGQTRLPCSCP